VGIVEELMEIWPNEVCDTRAHYPKCLWALYSLARVIKSKWVVRPQGMRSPLGIEFLCYWWAVIALSDYSRWMFRKNSMKFFVGLLNYLYYFYKWLYTTSPQSHDLLECSMIMWPCYLIRLPKFLCYLYLDSVVWLDIVDQVFKCMGNFFFLGLS